MVYTELGLACAYPTFGTGGIFLKTFSCSDFIYLATCCQLFCSHLSSLVLPTNLSVISSMLLFLQLCYWPWVTMKIKIWQNQAMGALLSETVTTWWYNLYHISTFASFLGYLSALSSNPLLGIVQWIKATAAVNDSSVRVAASRGCAQEGVLLPFLWCHVKRKVVFWLSASVIWSSIQRLTHLGIRGATRTTTTSAMEALACVPSLDLVVHGEARSPARWLWSHI